MINRIKNFVRHMFKTAGYEIRRLTPPQQPDTQTSQSAALTHPVFFKHISSIGFKPRGILDVGANSGYWAVWAKTAFPDAGMLLIEPQEEMREKLALIQQKYNDIEVVMAGAGKTSGVQTLTIWEDLAGSSFLPPEDREQLNAGKQRKIRIVTIDELLKEHDAFVPDLVKLDIQGYELEALEGGQALFSQTELFIVETSLYDFLPNMPNIYDVIRYMADRDYVIYDVTELSRRPLDNALAQIDVIFVKKQGRFRVNHSWD